ncbi:class I SAM-dependent methyltransferase [Paenibacillus nanensis]|uniref:Class I SAM-dependent methyltransferase n=1 Tax=Paenibacillus nanensis TaxID=393251 RepID=A0A3A1UPW2_9BACL|nr:class I SAM-dependent methyltransferase [Paenibacillus nanensis]RIX50579.1 class I SAM-dependent methyltransferase [Paenibacillus nanensis]
MDNKERFSNRVEHYVKYRPTYPREAIDFLYDTVGFRQGSVIADVGSGTGIFSKLLLERGSRVIGVEPNEAMRKAAVAALGEEERYSPADGSAEETGLSEQSVDFIVCAQSYHWFDKERAREEFRRILKPGGKVVLIWNSRKTSGTPFLEQFERLLLTYGTDYEKVAHKSITLETLKPYFAEGGPRLDTFSMVQLLDEEGLAGRLLSSSYSPLPGHPHYEPMMRELRDIYQSNEENGFVAVEYATELYWGEV